MSRVIENIGNDKFELEVQEDAGRCFWRANLIIAEYPIVKTIGPGKWELIPRSLYIVLNAYQDKLDAAKKPPAVKIDNCPHCGCEPEVQAPGRYIEISCCASMVTSKIDSLSIAEAWTWNEKAHGYSPAAERKALEAAAAQWNVREKG